LGEQTVAAAKLYAEDVRTGRFPAVNQRAIADLVGEAK
jgi:ketopantoate hydroxymethyltransferase